jgi:large subunit ribosomal protein L21
VPWKKPGHSVLWRIPSWLGKVQAHNEFIAVRAPLCATELVGGIAMYAVIRAGGKQYRVAPGDVIEIEKLSQAGGEKVQFDEVLAVSDSEGALSQPTKAFVTGQVVEQGRGDKVLVFHYKRKKQYKKLNGHRQPYTAVKITGIHVNGKELTA